MSLRCVGNQLLQTAPSPLLAGASTASLSLWIRINPGHHVSNPNGVKIFGDEGGKFSATLTGSDGLQLRWSSTNGGSSCALTLVPGTSYHLAATWRDGSQGYYLDGVQVGADTQAGSIGVVGDAATRPYRLGSDSSGVDATLGDPTLWVGHALSRQEVLDLRDRAAQPSGIAPSAIALRWSLAGPDAVAAKVGDAGLADASPTGLDLSTVVGAAPTYQAADLAHVASPAIGHATAEGPGQAAAAASPATVHAMASGSGQSIAVFAVDGSGNPVTMTSVSTGDDTQTFAITGTTIAGSFTATFNGQTTGAINYTPVPPDKQGTYAFAGLASGHHQRVSINWPVNPYASNTLWAELIDSTGLIVTTLVFNETVAPSSFSEGTLPDGHTAYWQDVTSPSGFVPTGGSFSIRFTANTDNTGPIFMIPAVRILDIEAAGSPTYYDPTFSGFSHSTDGFATSGASGYFRSHGAGFYGGGSGLGNAWSDFSAAFATAFNALSTVQSGGTKVTSNSNGVALEFVGPMGATAQSTVTTNSGQVQVSHSAGGVVPVLTWPGGPTITVPGPWIYQDNPANGPATQRPSSWAMATLYQASPRQTVNCRQTNEVFNVGAFGVTIDNSPGSGNYQQYSHADAAAIGLYSYESHATGERIIFPFEGLRPGLYDFAITWTPGSGLDTACPIAVYDGTAHIDLYTGSLVSGTPIHATTVNLTVAPADYTDQGHGFKTIGTGFVANSTNNKFVVTMATGSGVARISAVQMVPHSGNAASVVVPPGVVPTLTIPANFFTSANGAIGAQAITLDNRSGGSIFPAFDPTKVKMPISYNISGCTYDSGFIDFSNLFYRTTPQVPANVVLNADGFPTKLLNGYTSLTYIILEPNVLTRGDGRSVKNAPSGRYVLRWHGASDMSMVEVGGGTAVPVTGSGFTDVSTLEKIRTYDVTANLDAYSPSLNVYLSQSGLDSSDVSGNTHFVDVSNIRVYPPDPADPTGNTAWGLDLSKPPPKFHPSYLYKLQGMAGVRYWNVCGQQADYADFPTATTAFRFQYTRTAVVPVSRIEDQPAQLSAPNTIALKVTTPSPHGLYTGCPLYQFDFPGPMNFTYTGFVSGASGPTATYTQSLTSADFFLWFVDVISATQFTLHCGTSALSNSPAGVHPTMTNVITSGTAYTNIGAPWSPQDVCDLHTAMPNLKHCWFNTPYGASADCVTRIAQTLAAGLPRGHIWHHEICDELWNTGFLASLWAGIQSWQLTAGGSNDTYAGAMTTFDFQHRIAKAAWVAAGRSASDYVATVGGSAHTDRDISQAQYGSGDPSIPSSWYAPGQQLPMLADEIAIAPYLNNAPIADKRQNDNMTADQLLDLLELYVLDSAAPYVSGIRSAVKSYLPACETSIYETATDGGISPQYLDGGYPANYLDRMHRMHHHPRMYGIMLAYMASLDAQGVTLSNYFTMVGDNPFPYPAFEWYDQKRGTGSLTTEAFNITNYDDMSAITSPLAGALHDYNAALGSSGTTSMPKRYVPVRNGPLTTRGYPRGLTRPTR